jgi:hypothetical protein
VARRLSRQPLGGMKRSDMRLDEKLYLEEMDGLIKSAKKTLFDKHPNLEIYTINIWTDPDAAVSTVSFDTFENSNEKTNEHNKWAKKHYDDLIAEGDINQAKYLLQIKGRNYNSADFLLKDIVSITNQSFEPLCAGKTGGGCWDILEPLLKKVGKNAIQAFRDIKLHTNCELGVNSRRDWYSMKWLIK